MRESARKAGEITRRVTFVVVREAASTAELSNMIGAVPDSSTSRLDRTPTQATWEVGAEGSGNDDLTTMIESVITRIRPLMDHLREVCSTPDTTCILRIVQYVGRDWVGSGFAIEADEVALLAELGAFLDVDQYWCPE